MKGNMKGKETKTVEKLGRRLLGCMLVCALLCGCVALAEVPRLGEGMFKYAKNTLVCLSSGDYDKIVTAVPFSDVSPSADEWAGLAEGAFTSLAGSTPQKKYAVAYWTGEAWKLAVPVSEPSNADVEALVLFSEDGKSFSGYSCASWGKEEKEYRKAEYVQWNEEYNGSTSVIIEMDED